MPESRRLEQPWKVWYTPTCDTDPVHHVVPVMAEGNRAMACPERKVPDLGQPKGSFTKAA